MGFGLQWLLDRERDQQRYSKEQSAIAREVGERRNRSMVLKGGNEREVVERILRGGGETDRQALFELLAEQSKTGPGRRGIADEYGPVMTRGPGGFTKRGVMEAVHDTMANNVLASRSVIGGSAVLGGVGMTAGAQQLMALMQYLQAGQTTEAEAGQPLTS